LFRIQLMRPENIDSTHGDLTVGEDVSFQAAPPAGKRPVS